MSSNFVLPQPEEIAQEMQGAARAIREDALLLETLLGGMYKSIRIDEVGACLSRITRQKLIIDAGYGTLHRKLQKEKENVGNV